MALTTLDEICNNFQIILLDASAINHFLECKGAHSVKLKKRTNYMSEEKNSAIFFKKYLNKKDNFLITKKIFNEFGFDCYENSSIRKILSKYDFMKISKKEQKYYHEICDRKKEQMKLLKKIKKKRKILKLNSGEQMMYSDYFERNFYLKKKNKLSDADYDLLISGAVLSALRGNTAILSNDFPLLRSYITLTIRENLSQDKFGFFIRLKKEFFKKTYTTPKINLNS